MKNTLSDLNNYLFESIERIQNDELSTEDLDKEIKRASAVTEVAKVVVANGELALKTMKHLNEYGYEAKNGLAPVPTMLEAGK